MQACYQHFKQLNISLQGTLGMKPPQPIPQLLLMKYFPVSIRTSYRDWLEGNITENYILTEDPYVISGSLERTRRNSEISSANQKRTHWTITDAPTVGKKMFQTNLPKTFTKSVCVFNPSTNSPPSVPKPTPPRQEICVVCILGYTEVFHKGKWSSHAHAESPPP